MPILFFGGSSPTSGAVTITTNDLIKDALSIIRVARAGDTIGGDDLHDILIVLNRILDGWNANDRAVYAVEFEDYVLTPSLSPHTIGPGGTFAVALRPESIDYAAINLGSNIFTELTIRDARWYQQQAVPSLTTTLPTDLYYDPAWPLGRLYFWGVPTTAYTVRLWSKLVLSQVSDPTVVFSLPPGYQDALTKTLAEEIAGMFGQPITPKLERDALNARALVFGNNDTIPNLTTLDGGLPGGRGGGFDYRTGFLR